MKIRDFQASDGADVVELWQACGLTMPWNDPEADIRRCIQGPSSALLVGVSDARVVASAMVGHDGHRGWIYYVAVQPALQGRGLGRQIVTAAEAWLHDRDVPKVLLLVREGNGRVLPFYESLGYEEAPRILMSKWLVAPSAG